MRNHKRIRHSICAGLMTSVLTVSLGLATPICSLAEDSASISAELDEAKEQLSSLTHELELAQAKVASTEADLSSTQDRIADLQTQIADTQEQLASAQGDLSQRAVSSYKSGEMSLTEMILSSTSFQDLVSRLYYASRVADAEAEHISTVQSLQNQLADDKTELSNQESQLKDLLSQQTESKNQLAASQSETQSYVDGLSGELAEALESERAAAAEAARQAQEQAAAAAEKEDSQQQQQQSQQQQQQSQQQQQPSQTEQTPAPTPSTPVTGNVGNLSQSARNTIVSTANSQVGCAYGWGAMNPGVAFDCSGLTTYAYSCAGISLSRTAQGQYNQVANAGNLKTNASQLVPGDLVFYSYGGYVGHVGIYIGGGMVTHASDYSTGVITTSINYSSGFCGGGSPI